MIHRTTVPLLAIAVIAAATFDPNVTRGQESKVKDPVSQYALDLRARKATEDDFSDKTKTYGVEIYSDEQTGNGLYISETGSLAAVPSKNFKTGLASKAPLHRQGLSLNARPGGENSWDKAKKFGIEVSRDDVQGNQIYITQNGQVAVAPAADANTGKVEGKVKNPAFKYGMNLKVRKAGEKDWDKAKKVGVEVYLDENNGTTVYISETGSIAIIGPKAMGTATKDKDPMHQHGLEVSVRKTGEKGFTKDTKRVGAEVYQDNRNGAILYVTEAGNIAVVPGKVAKATGGDGKAKDVTYTHAFEVKVRKGGETDLDKAGKISVEVYKDENNGCILYISEQGQISAVVG
jgi:hypothetical protein